MFTPNDTIVLIPLTQGRFAIVDSIDADFVNQWKWCVANLHGYWYATRGINIGNRKVIGISMHRLILERACNRTLLSTELCDHVNGNTLDNRRENLRIATKQQNKINSKTRNDNTSGYKGISWDKKHQKWRARIMIAGKSIHIGYFETREQAYAEYCNYAKTYHGEYARLDISGNQG